MLEIYWQILELNILDKKILILLPIWKREKITQICLENLRELKKEIDLNVLCIVSESWAKIAAFTYGFKYVSAPNECLGTKMNIGVREAMKYKFDYLMNLGSDDIITSSLFKLYEPYFDDNLKMFGCTRLTFIDSEEKVAKTFDYKVLIGAGRCIRRDLIEELLERGEMYDNNIECGFDANSMRKFSRHSHTEIANDYNMIYDIKSDINIWNYKELPGEIIPFETAMEGLGTKQIDAILDL